MSHLRFSCTGTNSSDDARLLITSAAADLDILTNNNVTHVSIAAGDTLDITCAVASDRDDDNTDYEVNWYLSDSMSDRLEKYRGVDSFRVVVSGVRTSDSGALRCTARPLEGERVLVAGIILVVRPGLLQLCHVEYNNVILHVTS